MPPSTGPQPPQHSPGSSPPRHARKCIICRHPQRDAIEREFLAWTSPASIAERFALYDRRALYRHAHATGLFRRRTRRFAANLEGILEHASIVCATPHAIIRAVQLYARLGDIGVESSGAASRHRGGLVRRLPRLQGPESNRHASRSENRATHGAPAQ
jgi:hypothetical protein